MRVKIAIAGALSMALLSLGCIGDEPMSPDGTRRLAQRTPAGDATAPAEGGQRFTLRVGHSVLWPVEARQLRRFIQYRSSDSSVAAADKDGIVHALAAGEAVLTRSFAGQEERAYVMVTPAPHTRQIALVRIQPKSGAALMPSAHRQFTAEAIDAEGHVVTTPLTLSATGGQVTDMGYYTAGQISGAFMVVATCVCGLADTAVVTIEAAQQAQSLIELKIAPKVVTVQPGGTVQFSATARWRNGSTAVPPVSYTASGGTVSEAGRYTAPATEGSYQVIVAPDSGAIRDTAVVSVTTAPTPEPEGPPPPTAPGLAFFEDSFDNGQHGSANGFSWSRPGRVTVSDERAYSGRYALRFPFGPNDPGKDASAEQRFDIGRYMSELAVEYMLYVPLNYRHRDDRPANNKLIMLWRDVYSDMLGGTWQFGVEFQRRDDRSSNARVMARRWDLNSITDNGPWPEGTPSRNFPLIGDEGPLKIGAWNRVRIYAKTASSYGTADGILKLWVNDALLFSTSTGRFSNYYALPADVALRRGYLMGWSNSGYSELTVFYIDDFRLFSGNPGW